MCILSTVIPTVPRTSRQMRWRICAVSRVMDPDTFQHVQDTFYTRHYFFGTPMAWAALTVPINPPTPLWRWRCAYWGANSYTKCSITVVNIAVAISALAGGGQKRFRTETRIRWCFRHFSRIFGCLSARGYWNGILGHFGSFPAMEKRPKIKKHCT